MGGLLKNIRKIALHRVVGKGDADTVRKLIKDGFDVNIIVDGIAPLHYAVFHGRKEICRFLLENSA